MPFEEHTHYASLNEREPWTKLTFFQIYKKPTNLSDSFDMDYFIFIFVDNQANSWIRILAIKRGASCHGKKQGKTERP